MKLSTLFTVHAIVALLFGFGFVFAPAATLAPYGVTVNEGGILISRLLGAAFFGFSMISWFARNSEESTARQAIVLGYFLGFSVGFAASLFGQLSNVGNALGWSTVGIYLLLALGYGYFQFIKPGAS